MLQRRRLLIPDIDAGAAQMAGLQRLKQRRFVGDAAARRGHEYGAFFHLGKGPRIDHSQRLVCARTVDRHEIRLREQFVQRHRTRAAPGDFFHADVGVVGQHGHAEGVRQVSDARADMADPDNAENLAGNVMAHKLFAREAAFAPQPLVGFGDPLRQRKHDAEGLLRDRARVNAGLVDDDDAGLGAGGDIDRVVARAAGRDTQQLRTAFQQLGGRKPLLRQLVFRRRNQIDVGVTQIGPCAVLRALEIARPQLVVGFARKPLGHRGIVRKVESNDDFWICGHRTLKITPARGPAEAI